MLFRMLVPPKAGDPLRATDSAQEVGRVVAVKDAEDGEFIVTLSVPGLEGAAERSATRLEPAGGSDPAGGSTPPPSAE